MSPTHGSWNVDKAALIEMSPTIRTTRGHVEPVTLCWEQINSCMYVSPADIVLFDFFIMTCTILKKKKQPYKYQLDN